MQNQPFFCFSKIITTAVVMTIVILSFPLVSALAYDGKIDFAYMGGAYMMDKSGMENETILQFWENVLRKAGIKKSSINVENFVDERALAKHMASGEVVVAGVSHSFFSKHEKQLKLHPLVVPAIDGKIYIHYSIYARAKDDSIQNLYDIEGKKVSIPIYGDEWYYEKLIPGYGSKNFQAVKYPDNNSVINAVLFKKADAGVSSDSYLENFFLLRPNLEKKIKIISKTKKILVPPLVFQEGRLTENEKNKLISILISAPEDPELGILIDMIGFTGFREISKKEILKAIK